MGRVYSDMALSLSSKDCSDVDYTYTKSQNTNIIPLTRLLYMLRIPQSWHRKAFS